MKTSDIRYCVCGCGQPAKVYRTDTGRNKGWRAYASGHAPNEAVAVIVPTDPVSLAYLAGIVDGEGCVYARVHVWQNCYNTLISLSVNMNSSNVIEWIHRTFGGQVYSDFAPSRKAPLYHWQVRGRKVIPILTALLPYLIEKRKRAELALQLAAFIAPAKSGGSRRISAEEWTERSKLAIAIKTFNQNPSGESVQ